MHIAVTVTAERILAGERRERLDVARSLASYQAILTTTIQRVYPRATVRVRVIAGGDPPDITIAPAWIAEAAPIALAIDAIISETRTRAPWIVWADD